MQIIKADEKENINDFLTRVLETLRIQDCHKCYAEHDGTIIIVYQKSYILDLIEKYEDSRNHDLFG